MKRDCYSSTIQRFLDASPEEIIGSLTINSGFAVEPTQRGAWLEEIRILKTALRDFSGQVLFRILDSANGQTDRCGFADRVRLVRS